MLAGSNPWAPVSILVRKLQLEDARLVLAEISFSLPAAPPQPAARPDGKWRAPLVWWLAAIALGAIFTGIGLVQTVTSMEQCARGACEQPERSTP